MNLVQINERLKDLPMQVLQQYANGMNPEVPPYLALGELQRRETSQKQMATAQGGQQGPQSSIKEQVEQKAGLMALQQMQQQQMAQQMQQPQGPMPVPAGAPQPEMQPQAMMARGGLAGIPVRRDMFEYAGGGIIAFQAGGQPKYETRYDKMNRENRGELTEEERKRNEEIAALIAQIPRDKNTVEGGEKVDSTELERNIKNTLMALPGASASRALSGSAGSSRGAAAALTALLNKRDEQAPAEEEKPRGPMITSQGPGDVFAPRYPQGLPAALERATPARPVPARATAASMPSAQRPPQAAAPVPAPTAAQALPNEPVSQAGLPAAAQSINPYEARLNQVALKEPVAPTTQDAINRIKELSPEALQEDFIKKRTQEQRDRAAAERAAFQESRPSGLDNLIRVLGQAGQYKGFSGIGPAYTANKQQQRAEELAMEKRQNELLNAIDTGEYERGKALFTARTEAFDTAQQLFGKEKEGVVKATASLYETTQSRINNELKMLSDKEIQQLKMASDKEIAAMKEAGDTKRTQMTIGAANARDPNAMIAEYVGLKAKARELREKGDPSSIKEADRLMARASDIMEYKGGSSGAAGVGAERNDISRKRLQIQTWKDIRDGSTKPEAIEEAERNIVQLARDIAKIEGGGGVASTGVPLPSNASAKNLTVGTVYQTAKGPAKWTGTGFMPI